MRGDVLERRLQSWKDELQTNKHGMAGYAARAIKLIEADLASLTRSDTKGEGE